MQRFCVSVMPDCDRIMASYVVGDGGAVTMGRYAKSEDARLVLHTLLVELARDDGWFEMPPSILQGDGTHKHDVRAKRKGGS